jgi:hypothetical protein
MADFITRAGSGYDLTLAGEWVNTKVNMNVHVLKADIFKLKKTVDRYLNFPGAPGTYLPFGNRVMIGCSDVAEGRAGDPNLGYMHEVEVSCFVLVLWLPPKWPFSAPPRIFSFSPYLFVNNVWAMVTGREIHGFRKDLATSFSTIDIDDGPKWNNQARNIQYVETWAMQNGGTNDSLKKIKVLEINNPPSAGPSPVPNVVGTLIGDGLNDVMPWLPANPLKPLTDILDDLLNAMMQGTTVTAPMAFLRQFRDPRKSKQADVQEVIHAGADGELNGAPSLMPKGQILVRNVASHPVAEELGLAADTWLTPELSVDVSLKVFTLRHAK